LSPLAQISRYASDPNDEHYALQHHQNVDDTDNLKNDQKQGISYKLQYSSEMY